MENVPVILVDQHDRAIGVMEKHEAHHKALLHRAVSVFIFNSSGKWLLQQRAKEKYHSNSLWTNTCCTHPLPGESNLRAAKRRLAEEMGIQCDLEEVFWFIYKENLDNELAEHELDHVFIGISDSIPVIDRNEVMDFVYLSTAEVKAGIDANPENYTVWFRKIFSEYRDKLFQSATPRNEFTG